jgi:hypothetical protein
MDESDEKRRNWLQEFDHEDGYELKEKGCKSMSMEKRRAGDH